MQFNLKNWISCMKMGFRKKKNFAFEICILYYIFYYPKVMVYTQMQSYSLFDLVVDLGSSLGLWLGISALGIVDFIIQVTLQI